MGDSVLPLFMGVLIVREDNQYRYYRLSTQPTLFGEWMLVREWGRIGSCGTMPADWYSSEGEALNALSSLARRKKQQGYIVT